MALTLNIGTSGSVGLKQSPTTSSGQFGSIVSTGPGVSSSTAGTCLVAILTNISGATITAAAPGWVQAGVAAQASAAHIEVWIYPNNPGGITVFNFTQSAAVEWSATGSEWTGIHFQGSADTAFGAATSTSGTTLTPTTAGNVLTSGDLAISCWVQKVALSGVTFTTPAGLTRLVDDGVNTDVIHLDAEYKISPTTGAPLGPVLTSTGTTLSAAGVIVVLKKAPPVVDQTAFLSQVAYATLKFNTFDFALEDPATVPSLGDPVALTTPTWNGRVVSVTVADIVDLATGHKRVSIVAVNQSVPAVGSSGGGFSDTPNNTTTFGYRQLSVQTTANVDGTSTTVGSLEALVAAMMDFGNIGKTFTLTSANLGFAAEVFVATSATINWIGLQVPIATVNFGDPYPTLATAGGGILARPGASTQAGINMPAGTLGYAEIRANQTGITTQTDITGLVYTVTTGSGRRIKVRGKVLTGNTLATGQFQLFIMEGATQLEVAAVNYAFAGLNVTAIVEVVLTPTAGVHTYKLQGLATTRSSTVIGSASVNGHLTIEDIGT